MLLILVSPVKHNEMGGRESLHAFGTSTSSELPGGLSVQDKRGPRASESRGRCPPQSRVPPTVWPTSTPLILTTGRAVPHTLGVKECLERHGSFPYKIGREFLKKQNKSKTVSTSVITKYRSLPYKMTY